ncbi:MAG TPA: Ig-like domain-containing protein [Candidatus Paceibacterota bacterium]|nr:Ig-like domain-containing protein [Candidatus Paceibacterota bacterium]
MSIKRTLAFVFFASFFAFALTSHAATYYVSSSAGSDSNSGTSSSSPWQTLAKINATTLKAGDSVLFARGDTFYGSLTVSQSGSSGSPITYGAYGTGANPVISGFTTLSGWASVGNGVYQAACTSCGSTVNMVLLNGSEVAMGRWPNANASNGGYRTITSVSGSTSFTDSSLSSASSNDWTGAEVVIRQNHWTLDRAKITSQSANTINFTPSTSYTPVVGFGYFIQNDPRTLDAAGEWYYNPSTKMLEMYFGSSGPGSSVVQVSSVDTLLSIVSHSYITVNNLSLQGSNLNSILVGGSSNVTVNAVNINFSGMNAVWGGTNYGTASSFLIENSTINNTNNNAITFNSNFQNPTVTSNLIENTGLFAGMGDPGNGFSSGHKGISAWGPVNGLTVTNNQVINTGYIPITFQGSNVTIQNNYIDTFCTVMDDGGGIYTWNGRGAQYTLTNEKVIGNIVLNGKGITAGTPDTDLRAQGIYMDDNTANVEIANNTVAHNAHSGFFLHLNNNLNVHDNLAYDNGLQQLAISGEDTLFLVSNLSLNKNTFVASAGQYDGEYDSYTSTVASFGAYDNNIYARPIDDTQTMFVQTNKFSTFAHYTLAQWQAYSGQDAHSTKSPVTISSASNIFFDYNASGTPKTDTLSGTYVDMTGATNGSCSVTIPAWGSVVLLKTSSTCSGSTDTTPPTVSLSAPLNGATVSGTALTTAATASDNVGVTKVEFYKDADTTPFATDTATPYSASFDTTTLANGTHTFTAKASDAAGNSTTSSAISVTVSNAVPVVNAGTDQTIILPASSTTLTGTASDPEGASLTTTWSEVSGPNTATITAPSSLTTSVTGLIQGTYTFWLTASDGVRSNADAIAVTVAADTQAPSVPTALTGTTTMNSATLSWTAATDNVGVTSYIIYRAGTKVGTSTTTTYTDSGLAPATTYSYTVAAADAAGNTSAQSTAKALTTAADTQAPSVNITSPLTGVTVASATTLTAAATDNTGVTNVQFFLDGIALGDALTTSPYTLSWNTATTANGSHVLSAVASDAAGNRSTSNTVTVTVSNATSANNLPDLTIAGYPNPFILTAENATVNFVVTVYNIGSAPTVGTITVQVPKIAGFTDSLYTTANWSTLSGTSSYYQFASKNGVIIPAGGSSVIVLRIKKTTSTLTPTSMTLAIQAGSGGETNTSNNTFTVPINLSSSASATQVLNSLHSSSTATVGSSVTVTATTLNVRATPGGSIIGTVHTGDSGTLQDTSVVGNTTWGYVQFTTGISGWVSMAYITGA